MTIVTNANASRASIHIPGATSVARAIIRPTSNSTMTPWSSLVAALDLTQADPADNFSTDTSRAINKSRASAAPTSQMGRVPCTAIVTSMRPSVSLVATAPSRPRRAMSRMKKRWINSDSDETENRTSATRARRRASANGIARASRKRPRSSASGNSSSFFVPTCGADDSSVCMA
ncbi:MAG TPA: hypothetical protein VIN58_16365 [Roseateles sp.]